jgi:dTMP kinase
MKGALISFEGTEGCGKTTQIALLMGRVEALGRVVRLVREPGGTPIGEEIRYTLKHSASNHAMMPEAELLMMNASRAQLVREILRPALAAGEIVLCDRYYDSTIAYQGYGRGLDLQLVRSVVAFAVGDTRPDLTLLLQAPPEVSAARLASRQSTLPFIRDRIEEADRAFFERVRKGYDAIAAAEPDRIKSINAVGSVGAIGAAIWREVEPFVAAGQASR